MEYRKIGQENGLSSQFISDKTPWNQKWIIPVLLKKEKKKDIHRSIKIKLPLHNSQYL